MWLVLALVAAFLNAVVDILIKRQSFKLDPFLISWGWIAFTSLILLPTFFIFPIPGLDTYFWLALTGATVLNVIIVVFYTRALAATDVTLATPLLALTPVFLIAPGILINQETPTLANILGILIIVIGAYWLNLPSGYQLSKWHQPFQNIWTNQGTRLMLIMAVVAALANSFHKLAIVHSDPYFYGAFGALATSVVLTPFVVWSYRQKLPTLFQPALLKSLALLGSVQAMALIAEMVAQSLSLVVLVIAVKRTSILFSALMAAYYFREPVKRRLVPICLIVVGVLVLLA